MLAFATTTITISRAPNLTDLDPYDPQPPPQIIATGVRAVIGAERGSSLQQGTTQETVAWRLDADPCPLLPQDTVLDEQTGALFNTDWSRARTGLGLDHVEASLRQVNTRNPALA